MHTKPRRTHGVQFNLTQFLLPKRLTMRVGDVALRMYTHNTEMQIDVSTALILAAGCHGCFYDDTRASTMTLECGWLCQRDTQPGAPHGTQQQEARIKLINRDERKYGIGLTRKRFSARLLRSNPGDIANNFANFAACDEGNSWKFFSFQDS